HQNLCCVGDDDQSIYAWRGAEITNILRFEKDFPGAIVIRLEQNYRSTPHILGAASGLIDHNKGRLGKKLWTETDQGEKVTVFSAWDGREEARQVGSLIEDQQREGRPLHAMAILVRASFQTREFEDQFIKMAIPYRVIGGLRFYERMEIRDAIAYLRVITHPSDSLAFERIVNTPKRGIGNASIQILNEYARMEQIPMLEAACRLIETDEIRGKARSSLQSLIQDLGRWRSQIKDHKPSELAGIVLDESGYSKMWKDSKEPDAPSRIENLKELVRAIGTFPTIHGFLEHVSLVMDNQDASPNDQVSLMTIHAAKGLEFDCVFLTGWEEELFPHPRTIKESGTKGLEEERRLAYVGITRARERVYISHANQRFLHGRSMSAEPSRFLDELDHTHVEMLHDPSVRIAPMPRIANTSGGSSFKPVKAVRKNQKFSVGNRVSHQRFGGGVILAVDGDKLEIFFDSAGKKRVIDKFVEKE
ncbi:MAG: ATP-dependent helicase, partial [Alphaproteobacteria bacterium]